MGGADSHHGQKKGLSLFGVCLFFGGFWSFEKSRSPAPKKPFGGKTWAGPSTIISYLITLDKVLEANNDCDGFLPVPDQILLARHLAFIGDLQTTTIACHPESVLSFDYLGCKRLVTTQIKS